MRVGLGVSTGTEVVCAALVVAEDDGSHTVEYRTVSADTQANTDIGDLVASAVELMTSLAPAPAGHGAHSSERLEPESIAVSYRTPEQAASIRSACAHSTRTIALIPEHAAAHAFLAESGLIARYAGVAVVDIGASGTTMSILDSQSGAVHGTERTDTFGGDVIDALVKDLVHGEARRDVRDDLRDDRGIGSARYRAVKEHLSTHDSADLDREHSASTVDRADFDAVVRPLVATVAHSTARLATDVELEAVVLIGGGANTPSVRTAFEATLGLPVLVVPEPDTVLAQGAAQVSLAGTSHPYPTIGARGDGQTRSVGRFSGALVGALVVGGIVLAYGLQTLVPSDDSGFSPAGSAAPSEPQTSPVDEQVLSTTTGGPATGTGQQPAPATSAENDASYSQRPTSSPADVVPSTPAPSSTRTPTLHPAPDLPVIPFPAQPTEPASPPPPVTPTPEPPTSPPVETTEPVTPTPSPEGPTESPSDSPSESPSKSTAIVPAPSIPTTVVDRSPTSPELAPPPTVWTPPPPQPSVGETEQPAPTTTSQPNPTTTSGQ